MSWAAGPRRGRGGGVPPRAGRGALRGSHCLIPLLHCGHGSVGSGGRPRTARRRSCGSGGHRRLVRRYKRAKQLVCLEPKAETGLGCGQRAFSLIVHGAGKVHRPAVRALRSDGKGVNCKTSRGERVQQCRHRWTNRAQSMRGPAVCVTLVGPRLIDAARPWTCRSTACLPRFPQTTPGPSPSAT